jgi:hypothetical protein
MHIQLLKRNSEKVLMVGVCVSFLNIQDWIEKKDLDLNIDFSFSDFENF